MRRTCTTSKRFSQSRFGFSIGGMRLGHGPFAWVVESRRISWENVYSRILSPKKLVKHDFECGATALAG